MKIIICFIILLAGAQIQAQKKEVIHLWPGNVPGETLPKSEPRDNGNHDRNVLRVTDITNPAIVVYPADPAKNNGGAVIIGPGGGFSYLAIDIEGYEIAEWLNSLGYSAFVLEYRAPAKQEGAFPDVQRAIRYGRGNSKKWNIQPDKIGAMGFSAGAALSAWAGLRYNEKSYKPVDALDSLSARPDFALLIYPGALDRGPERSLSPGLKVTEETPPMFVFATADDNAGNSALVMTQALRDAKVPVELHFLPTGGHGYGLRKGNPAAEAWPVLAAAWLSKTTAKK